MMNRTILIAVALSAGLRAQELSTADRYLTAVAARMWTGRDARVAQIRTPAEVEERQRYIRSKIGDLLGGFPERTPLNARITGSFARDGYRVEKLIFESRPKLYVTADVYVPASGHAPYPAVLGVAGHSDASKATPIYQRGWISLAKRGYLVLAFDPPGQGERTFFYDAELGRSRLPTGTAEHTSVGLQCFLTGGSLAQFLVWDGIRAVDYLLTRQDVDPKRLAVAGNSGGGTQAAYLAAMEPRLAAAAPSCFMTSSEKLWTDLGPQDAEQNIAGFLAAGLDIKDFALSMAPKPFQMLAATRDFFPIAGTREAFAEAKRIYAVLGHPEGVNFFEFDDTHAWSQPRREATYRWFQRWLNDRPLDEGVETQFDVEPEANLWATATGQLETSLKGETVQSINAREAARLASARPVLSGEALKQAIVRRIAPIAREPRGPMATLLGETGRDGYRIVKMTLASGEGIAMPAILVVPAGGSTRKPAVVYLNPAGTAADTAPGGDIDALARAGQIVLAPDLPAWGEPARDRNARPPNTSLYRTSMRAMLVGRTIAGMQVTGLVSAIDYLESLPNVEAGRIGVFAKGNAGAVALYGAALEPRIRKVVCEGGPVSYLDIARARFHGEIADLLVPGVLRDFDLPDVAAALAPRPLWIVDPRMPTGSRQTLEAAAPEYRKTENFRLLSRTDGWSFVKIYESWLAR